VSKSKASFQDELARLEAVVRRLEDTDLDLDEALALFEEGVVRLKTARDLLQQSELTVKRVLEDADGTIRAGDLGP
jgi:exodeoxyribonuclease VII small subunit